MIFVACPCWFTHVKLHVRSQKICCRPLHTEQGAHQIGLPWFTIRWKDLNCLIWHVIFIVAAATIGAKLLRWLNSWMTENALRCKPAGGSSISMFDNSTNNTLKITFMKTLRELANRVIMSHNIESLCFQRQPQFHRILSSRWGQQTCKMPGCRRRCWAATRWIFS